MPSKPDQSDSTNQPTAELRRLVSDLLDEQISSQQHERLAELLRGDETARAYYLDQMANHAVLQWDTATAPSVERDPTTSEQSHQDHVRQSTSEFEPGLSTALNHLVNDADAPDPDLTSLALGELHEIAEADRRKPKTILMWLRGKKKKQQQAVTEESHEGWNLRPMMPYAAAAAVVLVVSLTLVLWPRQSTSMETVATLNEVAGATFKSRTVMTGDDMKTGRYQLETGIARITFHGGASVVIEAPSQFELKSVGGMRMHRGRLVAKVPARATGFTVHTPHADVVDLGTEFALDVDEDGFAEVHVIEGEVEVRPTPASGDGSAIKLTAGQARRWSSTIDPADTALSEPRFATKDFSRSVRALPGTQTIGNSLVGYANDAVWEGQVFVFDTSFLQRGRIVSWSFFDDDAHTPSRQITPLIIRQDGNRYHIVAIGKTRTSDASGIQTYPFEPISGSQPIRAGDRFGWKDGADGVNNPGVADFQGDGGWSELILLGRDVTSLKVGATLERSGEFLDTRKFSMQIEYQPEPE